MKQIPLTQGKVALVDDADYEYLSQYRWYLQGRRYAAREVHGKTVMMHREILGLTDGEVDHINGNGLDNRRQNLRTATRSENNRNRRRPNNNTSGYKGVHWRKDKGQWQVTIKTPYAREHIGYFNDLETAAHAYDEAARKLHGPFANTNF